MKKLAFFAILLCTTISDGFAQTRRPPIKKVEPPAAQAPAIAEFSEAEWKTLTDFLEAENWNASARLAAQYLEKFKIDNEKKQLARLRYFYLYALSGKILAASSAPARVPVEIDSLWKESDAAVGNFIGKEFVFPPRRALPECREVLNYICAVTSNDRALRVTATNKKGTLIHSFEYVAFDERIAFDQMSGKEIFLGGRLKRAEFNQDMSKPWAMRLTFEKGFARIVAADDK